MRTATGILIGDEILSGKFRDENGPFLIDKMRSKGVRLLRLATIPDELEEIASEVRWCSEHSDVVFTSGGVGPTHDDRTLEAVAMAFGVPLVQHAELVHAIQRFNLPLNGSTLRMATVPEGTELVSVSDLRFPALRFSNIYMLPGIPKLFRLKVDAIAEDWERNEAYSATVRVTERETDIAERLRAIDAAHPEVIIGSYPRIDETEFRVVLTLESANHDSLEAAKAAILREISVLVDE